jgi:adenosylmethionine-8-amino-7-oxononanoate aminotransferase
MHAFTYSAHPTLCAVAHANLDIIEREGLVERAARMGARLHQRLGELRGESFIKDVRGRGMMAAFDLHEGAVQGGAAAVVAAMKECGVFTRHRSDTVMLAPPLVIKEEELEELSDTTISTVRDLARRGA